MFEVGVAGEFTAIHSLVGDVSPQEKVPHPHNYKLEWMLHVQDLDEQGFSVDISMLERVRDRLFMNLEDQTLNDLPWFGEKTTSLEYLCGFVWESLERELRQRLSQSDIGRIKSMRIKVWENAQAWAGLEAEFNNRSHK